MSALQNPGPLRAAMPSIEPSQSASMSMVCDTDVRVRAGETGFTVLEGGRQVGQGQVQLP